MKILVKQCPDSSRWYAKYIGVEFPILNEFDKEFLTLQPAAPDFNGYRFKNYILKTDAEVIYE